MILSFNPHTLHAAIYTHASPGYFLIRAQNGLQLTPQEHLLEVQVPPSALYRQVKDPHYKLLTLEQQYWFIKESISVARLFVTQIQDLVCLILQHRVLHLERWQDICTLSLPLEDFHRTWPKQGPSLWEILEKD